MSITPKNQIWKLFQVISDLFLYSVLEYYAAVREYFLVIPNMMK